MPQEEHKEEEAKSGAREPLRAPAFFREWKRAQREATCVGEGTGHGGVDNAGEAAATGVSARDLESSRPRRPSVQAAGRRSAQAMREGVDLGLEGINRAGRGIRDGYNEVGKGIKGAKNVVEGGADKVVDGVVAARRGAGRAVDGATDAVTRVVAKGGLRVAGNLRVLTPLLDTFFEDLDPKTVRLDDRGLEIYAPSKIKQETLTALLGGCCPYGNVRLGPLRIELPLDEIAARAGDTPTRAAFTSISLELLPFPDLLHHDDVVRILSDIKDADKTAKEVLGEDYEANLTPKQRERHHRNLRRMRREIRDTVLIEELEAKHPRAARRLHRLEGVCFTLFIFFLTALTVGFISLQGKIDKFWDDRKSTKWVTKISSFTLLITLVYTYDIIARIWCYHKVRPRGWKQFFETRLNWIDFIVAASTLTCYLVFVIWYDTGGSERKFLYMNKKQATQYLIPAIRALRLATGILRLLRAFFRRKPVSMLRYVDGADVFIEKVQIYAHEATAPAADAWYDALRRNLGDRVVFDRKGVRGAARDFLREKIDNITKKLERAHRHKDADQIQKFTKKRTKFQEKLEAMSGSKKAVYLYDGDAEASYELRGVELLNARADGSAAPSRNLADCTVTGLHRDIGEQVAAVAGTPGAYNAMSTYKQLRISECRLGATSFRVEGALALRRRVVDETLVRIDADVRVKDPVVVDEGTGIYAPADHAPMTLVVRGGRAALTRGVSRTYAEARRGSWDGQTDDWVEEARQAAGRALLWLPLQRWMQTVSAAQYFYERDTLRAETKKYSEDSFLRRLAEMNLVLDAAEYETLRRVAFGDGDPTLPAFKEAMRLDERTKPHAALHHSAHGAAAVTRADVESAGDIEAPPAPGWAPSHVRPPPPPPPRSFGQRLLEKATKKIVARFIDPILEALIIDPAWSLDLRRRVVVLEPGILIDDAVIALFGGTSNYRSVGFGRVVAHLPPFRELYDQDLKTPVRVHVEALEAHQATVPRSLPPDVAGELLRPLFGDPHKPAKPPAPHGFVDTLLDTLEITIDTFKLHKHPLELTMKACTDKDAHAVALWNRSLGTGGSRVISAKDVRLSNVVDRTGIVSRTVAEGIVPVRRRLAFRELSIVDVGRLGNEVPFLRPADGAISIAMDRRVSDGAVVSTSFDVHIPQRGAGVFHLALASLPVSTIVSLKLRVGDQSPLR